MGLGKMSHSRFNYAIFREAKTDYESACTRAYAWRCPNLHCSTAGFAIITAVTFRYVFDSVGLEKMV